MPPVNDELCSLKPVLAIVFIISGVDIPCEFSKCITLIVFVINP
jgi:hypothetical protein